MYFLPKTFKTLLKKITDLQNIVIKPRNQIIWKKLSNVNKKSRMRTKKYRSLRFMNKNSFHFSLHSSI